MVEVWKDIEGYEGRYQVSSAGRVRSFSIFKRGRILKGTASSSNDYILVGLYDSNKKCRLFTVHRLVANAFIPNPNGYEVVHHKNGNRHCNTVDNLEWTTRGENAALPLRGSNHSPERRKKISDSVKKNWEKRRGEH